MDQDNRNRKPAASSQRKNEEDYVFGTGGSNVQYSFQRLPYDRSRPEGQQQLHHQDGLYRCGPVAESPSAPAPYTMWTVSSPGASAIAGGGSGFRLGNYDHQVASLPPASNTSPPQTIRRRSNISTSPSTIEADDDSNRINVNEESVIDVEALMTKELRELTAQERNTIMEELHGVTVNMVNEECDATFVNDKLSSLDVELNKIKKNKQAYERALFLRPSYVKDRNFRLMFLRADEFDVTKAARRILNHFQLKLSLFGLDKLVKDITMDDLSDEDILLLKEGYQQIMPVKDRAGRTIVVMQNQLSNDIICHKQVRAYMALRQDCCSRFYTEALTLYYRLPLSISIPFYHSHPRKHPIPTTYPFGVVPLFMVSAHDWIRRYQCPKDGLRTCILQCSSTKADTTFTEPTWWSSSRARRKSSRFLINCHFQDGRKFTIPFRCTTLLL